MDSNSLLKDALNLTPAEKLYLIEMISNSLSEPDINIENIWKEEVEKRYQDLVQKKVKTISIKEFND